MIVILVIIGWLTIGYVIAMPLCALFDMMFKSKERAGASLYLIFWPLVVVFALIALPYRIRNWIYKNGEKFQG